MTKCELIMIALKELLEVGLAAKMERNTALPEKIPAGGLIVLRDGNPGDPEQALGGFGGVYYSQDVEIEVYVEDGDAATRDTAFDTLLQQIGSVLDADPTLGGLAFGMTYGRPEVHTEAVTGAPAIKAGTITVTIEFETDSPLG